MTGLPESVIRLAAALRQFPGIGPRSAERMALFLVQSPETVARHLAKSMLDARDSVKICVSCGGLTETQPCKICDSPVREKTIICVVETALDLISIEKTGGFKGLYHVLGGKISPLNGVSAEDLRISELTDRLNTEPIKEVLVALPTDVEGDATSHYLAHLFQSRNIRVTRIAYGIPVGSGLEFTDELTLRKAIEGRRVLE